MLVGIDPANAGRRQHGHNHEQQRDADQQLVALGDLERVLAREHRIYPLAVRWFAEDRVTVADGEVTVEGDDDGEFPARRVATDDRVRELRYGENPHQAAALYADGTVEEANVVAAEQLNAGAKALSYNNYNDADGALNLIKEFDAPAAAVIKHTNPAGCATAETLADAYADALSTDAKSAFGGVVALNRFAAVHAGGEECWSTWTSTWRRRST